jgi:hypothetical protein
MKRWLITVHNTSNSPARTPDGPSYIVASLNMSDCMELLGRLDLFEQLYKQDQRLRETEYELQYYELSSGPHCKFTLFQDCASLTEIALANSYKPTLLPDWFNPNFDNTLSADVVAAKIYAFHGLLSVQVYRNNSDKLMPARVVWELHYRSETLRYVKTPAIDRALIEESLGIKMPEVISPTPSTEEPVT